MEDYSVAWIRRRRRIEDWYANGGRWMPRALQRRLLFAAWRSVGKWWRFRARLDEVLG